MEWYAFRLRPDTPDEGMPHPYPADERRQRRQAIQPMLEDAGLTMVDHEWIPNTQKALEAAEFARDHGKLDKFHRAVFHAYFAEGRDIGQIEVLQDIARNVGLDADELARALNERRYAERVSEEVEIAARIGVTGVPFFIVGNRGIVGAQPYEVFEHVMGLLGREKKVD